MVGIKYENAVGGAGNFAETKFAHCDKINKKPDEGFLRFTMEQRLNVPYFDNVI